MAEVSKVTFKLPIADKLKGVKDKKKAVEEIGDYLIEEILQRVGEGVSPVTGKPFKALDPKYKELKKEISGSAIPNLELYGDMLDALDWKLSGNSIEVGIWKKSEVPKADGHNNHSGDSKIPTRRFIPKEGEDKGFMPAIMREIDRIAEEYKDED